MIELAYISIATMFTQICILPLVMYYGSYIYSIKPAVNQYILVLLIFEVSLVCTSGWLTSYIIITNSSKVDLEDIIANGLNFIGIIMEFLVIRCFIKIYNENYFFHTYIRI